MGDTSVKINDAALSIDGRVVFDGLTLAWDRPRVGVIGRNGAGKSQLARLIAGLVAPDRGTVRVCGVDVARDRRAALQTVGILFQNPDHQIIFPSVTEELAFGPGQMGLPKAEVAQAVQAMLARFDRADWAGRAIHTLSQGQRHLVCLMAVLLMQPRVIVLDEPFAGLDLATVTRLQRHLAALPQALVQVTHDLDSIAGYDHVIWLDAGALRMQGPPAMVLPAYRAAMSDLGGRDAFADL